MKPLGEPAVKKLAKKMKRVKEICGRAPSLNQSDERELMRYQIELLAEILGALWRIESQLGKGR